MTTPVSVSKALAMVATARPVVSATLTARLSLLAATFAAALSGGSSLRAGLAAALSCYAATAARAASGFTAAPTGRAGLLLAAAFPRAAAASARADVSGDTFLRCAAPPS
ncbi:MAG: hypothetical protein H0T45_01455, partial [Pyrinomonadaceae bacterium]|nr:hypothetical protein [Pyrinomonadaceae bacterium]